METDSFVQTPDVATGHPKLASDFIDTAELCRRLGVSRRTTSNLRERGKLPAVILGRLVRFHWPTVVETFLRQQNGQP